VVALARAVFGCHAQLRHPTWHPPLASLAHNMHTGERHTHRVLVIHNHPSKIWAKCNRTCGANANLAVTLIAAAADFGGQTQPDFGNEK
jgi:hypothetical protein